MSTKVKICGITSLSDALAIAGFGVNYLGFIVNCPTSRRSLSVSELESIVPVVKSKFPSVKCVGVFVDSELDFVRSAVESCGLDVVQLHGAEDLKYCQLLMDFVEVWKAIVIESDEDVDTAENYRGFVNRILFDGGRGSGKKIEFGLLDNVKVDVIAGGLGPDDFDTVVKRLNPEIVDFNSAVEISPGVKDLTILQKFFQS